jgi:methionine sulfoxide reductase heme-binding subunit
MSIQPAARSSNRLGHPLGTSRDWRRRLLLHHLPLALATGVVLVVFIGLSPFTSGGSPELDASRSGAFPTTRNTSSTPTRIDHGTAPTAGRTPRFQLPSRVSTSRLTVATGYLALGLLALTLLIGPANLLLRRRNPVSSSLRRDAGTWTAIASVVHVVLGLQLHGRGSFSFVDFFVADGRPLTNSFGLGNWTGLAALVIVVGLLALSTDGSLRELKARRWKNLQRLNYALFALVVLHAFFYGALLRTTSPFTLLLFFVVVAVFVGQAAGIWLWRRRHPRAVSSQRERHPAGLAG